MKALTIILVIVVVFVLYCYCKKRYKPLVIGNERLSSLTGSLRSPTRIPPPVDINPRSISKYILYNISQGNAVFIQVSGKLPEPPGQPDVLSPSTYIIPGGLVGIGKWPEEGVRVVALQYVIKGEYYYDVIAQGVSKSDLYGALETHLPPVLSDIMYNKHLQVTVYIADGTTFAGKHTYRGNTISAQGVVLLATGYGQEGWPTVNTSFNQNLKNLNIIDSIQTTVT